MLPARTSPTLDMSSQTLVRERHGDFLRLVCFETMEAHTWDAEWERYSPESIRFVKEYYRRFSVIYSTLRRVLPRDGEILEAGSGLGFWVSLLAEAGFAARGIDYSDEAIALARRTFPELAFDRGDVRDLPYADGSMAGYVSFGVAEHFREGPDAVLREAARVLRSRGVLFLAVPWISPLRRVQPLTKRVAPRESLFYQYFFERGELERRVAACGFRTLEHTYYGTMKTLRDVLRDAGWIRSGRPAASATSERNDEPSPSPVPTAGMARKLFWLAQNAAFENPIARRLAGHMLVVVAERR